MSRSPDDLFRRYLDSGSAEELAALFDATASELYAVAGHLTGNRVDAEDLVQATFLVVLERSASFDRSRRVVPWSGLRPMMPDMMPRVGPGRRKGVFYNTGHGHLGWTLSAATAEMVAMQVGAAE